MADPAVEAVVEVKGFPGYESKKTAATDLYTPAAGCLVSMLTGNSPFESLRVTEKVLGYYKAANAMLTEEGRKFWVPDGIDFSLKTRMSYESVLTAVQAIPDYKSNPTMVEVEKSLTKTLAEKAEKAKAKIAAAKEREKRKKAEEDAKAAEEEEEEPLPKANKRKRASGSVPDPDATRAFERAKTLAAAQPSLSEEEARNLVAHYEAGAQIDPRYLMRCSEKDPAHEILKNLKELYPATATAMTDYDEAAREAKRCYNYEFFADPLGKVSSAGLYNPDLAIKIADNGPEVAYQLPSEVSSSLGVDVLPVLSCFALVAEDSSLKKVSNAEDFAFSENAVNRMSLDMIIKSSVICSTTSFKNLDYCLATLVIQGMNGVPTSKLRITPLTPAESAKLAAASTPAARAKNIKGGKSGLANRLSAIAYLILCSAGGPNAFGSQKNLAFISRSFGVDIDIDEMESKALDMAVREFSPAAAAMYLPYIVNIKADMMKERIYEKILAKISGQYIKVPAKVCLPPILLALTPEAKARIYSRLVSPTSADATILAGSASAISEVFSTGFSFDDGPKSHAQMELYAKYINFPDDFDDFRTYDDKGSSVLPKFVLDKVDVGLAKDCVRAAAPIILALASHPKGQNCNKYRRHALLKNARASDAVKESLEGLFSVMQNKRQASKWKELTGSESRGEYWESGYE